MVNAVHADASSSVNARLVSLQPFTLWPFFLPLLMGCFSFSGGTPRSGEVLTSRVLSFVSGNLTVSGPYDIVLVPGRHVEARMPAAVLMSLVTSQTQTNSRISPQRGFLLSGQGTVELLIGIDALTRLEVKTTGSISSSHNLAKSNLSLLLGGTVSGQLSFNAGTLDIQATSPRNITLVGKVKMLRLQATDLTHIDLRRLEIVNSDIQQPGYGAVIKL